MRIRDVVLLVQTLFFVTSSLTVQKLGFSSSAFQLYSSFLGKASDEPFELKRARVAVDYGPRLIGCKQRCKYCFVFII